MTLQHTGFKACDNHKLETKCVCVLVFWGFHYDNLQELLYISFMVDWKNMAVSLWRF